MPNTSKTILFFGTEDFSAAALQALIDNQTNLGITIGAIITKPDTKRGRNKQLVKPRVKEIGEVHNIPVWQPEKLESIADDIRRFDMPAGVLVSYGKIIPQAIIDLFSPGIINIHPSLLPKYRGPSPIESAILSGDQTTGISIMQLTHAMDAGPVYVQREFALNDTETQDFLYTTLGNFGAALLLEHLGAILDNSLLPTPQDDTIASYCNLLQKSDSHIDWSKPAIQIEREIRAYHSWPGSRTTIDTIDAIITSAEVTQHTQLEPGAYKIEDNTIIFGTAKDSLRITHLKPVGKKEMPIQAFLTGYKNKLN